jgi:hypothetical protein
MEIGQRVKWSGQGMTVTSANGTIECEWEIVAIDEANQMCDCRVVYDNSVMEVNDKRIEKYNFDFVNKHKV